VPGETDGYRDLSGSEWGPRRSEPFDQDRKEGVRRGPRGSEGVRAVRSRSDGRNQTGNDERLRMALIGGPRRQARGREAVPVVRAVRPESDRGDQTRETDGCGRRRSSPRR
jgi:hypothetical protein